MSDSFVLDSTESLESNNTVLPFTGQSPQDIVSQLNTGGLENPNSQLVPVQTSLEDEFFLGQSPLYGNNSSADILTASETRQASSISDVWNGVQNTFQDAWNGVQNTFQDGVDFFNPDPLIARAPDLVDEIDQVYNQYLWKLGNPTSSVIEYNGYKYQLFDSGSIVESQYGTYPLYGAIRQKYLETDGGLNGYLGAPTSPEYGWNGITRQDFEGGYITWDNISGAIVNGNNNFGSTPEPVVDEIDQVYNQYSWKLGNPTSGVIDYNGYKYQLFDSGSIVESQYGTYPLYGAIRQKYLETDGGLNGYLGAPTSPEYGWNGITRQDFEGGYITWDNINGAIVNGSSSYQEPSYQPPSSGVSYEAQRILSAVEQVNPDQPYYLPHDITGDGINETFCNWFAADVLEVLEVPIPRDYAQPFKMNPPVFGGQQRDKALSANRLYNHFNDSGEWQAVTPSDASALANNGQVVVASSPTPVPGNSGHIAIVLPGSSESDIRVAQAGAINGKNLNVGEGFGSSINTTSFFTYVG